MTKLTPGQTEWIFVRIKRLADEYIPLTPLGEEDKARLMADVDDLSKRARGDKLTSMLLVAILEYLYDE